MRSQVTIFLTLVSNNPTLWTTKKKHRLALAFRTLFRGEGGVLSLKGGVKFGGSLGPAADAAAEAFGEGVEGR